VNLRGCIGVKALAHVTRISFSSPSIRAKLRLKAERSGKVSSMTFLRGASVMHTDTVELLPKEHAVHSIHYSFGGLNPDGVQKVHECGGEA
jgi:hypothetical protein